MRQLVRHGHFLVNGTKVDIPSFRVRPGQVVEVREKSRKIQRINDSLGAVERQGVPAWLELDAETFKGTVQNLPQRDDIAAAIEEQLIVELYSK